MRLSTTPRWEKGRLVPRPFVLRVYAAATPDGWQVMPGGFCRISDQPDARAVSMGEGVESADVWVLADKPGRDDQPAADAGEGAHRAHPRQSAEPRGRQSVLVRPLSRARGGDAAAGALPLRARGRSRRADERRAPIDRAAEGPAGRLGRDRMPTHGRARRRRRRAKRRCAIPRTTARRFRSRARARYAASVIRERLTPQTWQLIGRLEDASSSKRRSARSPNSEILDCVDEALTTIAALAGLFDENFNRGAGWIFYELGRRIERGINTCRLARHFAHQDATEHNLDVLLDLIDSQITYRSRT